MQITIHSIHFDADKKLLNFINKKTYKTMQIKYEEKKPILDIIFTGNYFLLGTNITFTFDP